MPIKVVISAAVLAFLLFVTAAAITQLEVRMLRRMRKLALAAAKSPTSSRDLKAELKREAMRFHQQQDAEICRWLVAARDGNRR